MYWIKNESKVGDIKGTLNKIQINKLNIISYREFDTKSGIKWMVK